MSDAPVDTPDATPEAETDPVRDAIVERFRAELGDAVLETVVARGDMWVRVDRASWRRAGEVAKALGFEYFCFLSGIDWLNNPELSSRYEQVYDASGEAEAADVAAGADRYLTTRTGGGDTRFQVFARLYDVDRKIGVTLKADLDDDAPAVDTWTPVFRGADWHEREAWEMFGFDFAGHSNLRHLYLPSAFEGFPLRKDFPLLARAVKPWPGLVDKEPVPGEGDEEEDAG